MSAGRKRGINSSGHRPPDKAPAPFNDTIAAIITPPGEGGIAAVRIAGELSRGILAKHFRPMASPRSRRLAPFHMRFGHFVKTGEAAAREVIVDEVMAVYMPEGKSYTGLEQVEIYCHGGRRVVREILNRILLSGARAAEPGEFTRLAFLSGRIDLAHAEAVAEIIAADTNTSYQSARDHLIGRYSKHLEQLREQLVAVIAEVEASIDFPDEELDTANTSKLTLAVDGIITKTAELAQSYQGGRILREGYRVVIAGRPNSGKSSLFNLLLKQERALVTPTAGTTRDYLSEWIELDGYAVNLVDTAGLRRHGGAVEKAGQKSALKIIGQSDLLIWMVDLSRKTWRKALQADLDLFGKRRILLVGNKIDLVDSWATEPRDYHGSAEFVAVSCLTGKGIGRLRDSVVSHINEKMPDLTSGVVVTSARHKQKLDSALHGLRAAREKIIHRVEPELAAYDLREAANAIDEITGKIYTEEILEAIFSRFCVGK